MATTIYNPAEVDFERPGKHQYWVAFHLDSSWGYSLVPLMVINGLRGARTRKQLPGVAVFSGTHGNEWEGQVAVKRLCLDLDPAELCGRIVLIPQLSQSACVANERSSPLDGVNMNRAFPGNAQGTVSYRIAHFVKSSVFPRVGVVLDLHSGGQEAVFPLCASFHPVVDPGQYAETAKVAQLFDTPFIFIYSTEMASGLLTSEAEAEGKVAVGGEFGFGESVNRGGVMHAYEGVKNVLRYYGMLPGEPVRISSNRPAPPRFIQAQNLADYIPCPKDGVWEALVEPGTEVSEGELLGRLHDFSEITSSPLEIRAHRSGILAALHYGALPKKGMTLYVIADEVEV